MVYCNALLMRGFPVRIRGEVRNIKADEGNSTWAREIAGSAAAVPSPAAARLRSGTGSSQWPARVRRPAGTPPSRSWEPDHGNRSRYGGSRPFRRRSPSGRNQGLAAHRDPERPDEHLEASVKSTGRNHPARVLRYAPRFDSGETPPWASGVKAAAPASKSGIRKDVRVQISPCPQGDRVLVHQRVLPFETRYVCTADGDC